MREDGFKSWLEAGGANSKNSRDTRSYAVRTIENNLAKLGSPFSDLDEAWKSDRFVQLLQKLEELREDFLAGGTEYKVLMPQAEKPGNRLLNSRAWLNQYGQFLSGEPRGGKDADRIRQYVLEHYIEPSRERESETVDVLVRDVNDALDLNQAWPNICQAISGPKFLELADVQVPERIGANQSSATVFRFRLTGIGGAKASVTDPRPFVLFDAIGQAFKPVLNFNRQTGHSAYRIKPLGASNKAEDAIEVGTLTDVARAMLIEGRPARIQSIRGGPVNYLVYGKQKLVRYVLDQTIAEEIGVPPQGELGQTSSQASKKIEPDIEMDQYVSNPTNLILYGPPGTGKTYATAVEAIRLCGEPVSQDRGEVMTAYRRLSEAGRIEFVTFHQSIAYEDFVEGLRPTQGAKDGSAGFELRAEQGVFRRIARRAETSTGPGDVGYSTEGRQVFKMSIGEAANSEDAYLFEEAIAGGYTLLGWDDIDWSDERFSKREAIIEAVREKGIMEQGEPTAASGRVQMPFIFRNWIKSGDIIVVSKGNGLFRAIGEVAGEYQFVPREGGGYAHRRAVRWLWIDRAGVPVSEIYAHNFSQKSVYQLTDAELNIPALERYISSQKDVGAGAPEAFVLIIDEINRANISKVFGELITLLEPDKRIGQPNALKVRLPYSGDIFGVPGNLHIIGTMNTADRSIALLDTALRRRFEFRELMPDTSLLGVVDGINVAELLATINERIEYLFDREHQIGHAYFMGCQSRTDVDAVMRHKIIPLLSEYFYEDWGKVAAVLGDAREGGADLDGRFIDRHQIKPPTGINGEDDAAPRYRWNVRSVFSYDDVLAK